MAKKTIKVLPNPWQFIHPELGPQAACPTDASGRDDSPLRWVGAARKFVTVEKRPKLRGLVGGSSSHTLINAALQKTSAATVVRPSRSPPDPR